MNQIIFFKNDETEKALNKDKKKYKIIFIIFLIVTIILSILFLNNLYDNYYYEILSNKLNNSYSISTLYSK